MEPKNICTNQKGYIGQPSKISVKENAVLEREQLEDTFKEGFVLNRSETAEHGSVQKEVTQDLERKLQREVLFRKLVEDLYSTEDEGTFLEILTKGIEQLGYQKPILGLFDEEKTCLILKTLKRPIKKGIGIRPVSQPEVRIELEKGHVFWWWTEGKSFTSDNIHHKGAISLSVSAIFECFPGEVISDAQSVVGVPLAAQDDVWGGLILTGALTESDFIVLESIGKVAGEALKRLRHHLTLHQQMEDFTHSLNQFHLLQEINNALNSTMDLEYILQILVKGLHVVFGYETPSAYLLNDDKNVLVVKEYYMSSSLAKRVSRLVGFQLKDYHIPLFEGSRLREALDTKTPLITGDIPDILRDFTNSEPMRKLAHPMVALGTVRWLAALPLIANDESVGMLVVTKKDEINPEDIEDLQGFLQQASLAIKRAELHSQLRESLEKVREANQMKSQFIDIASHELRTPLTSMRLYVDMIQGGKYGEISDVLQEKMGALKRATDRLQEIIDQTVTSSQIIRDKLMLTKAEFSLLSLIEEVVSRLEPLWEENDQKVIIKGKTRPLIKADREAMRKVVNALMSNAVKYSGKGSKITITMYEEPEEMKIAVSDEGIGISPEYKEKIFEEFFIVPPEEKYARIDGRTGLGLFISKGIVEEHGGKIWVESVYGKGSTFYFTIPKGGR